MILKWRIWKNCLIKHTKPNYKIHTQSIKKNYCFIFILTTCIFEFLFSNSKIQRSWSVMYVCFTVCFIHLINFYISVFKVLMSLSPFSSSLPCRLSRPVLAIDWLTPFCSGRIVWQIQKWLFCLLCFRLRVQQPRVQVLLWPGGVWGCRRYQRWCVQPPGVQTILLSRPIQRH